MHLKTHLQCVQACEMQEVAIRLFTIHHLMFVTEKKSSSYMQYLHVWLTSPYRADINGDKFIFPDSLGFASEIISQEGWTAQVKNMFS